MQWIRAILAVGIVAGAFAVYAFTTKLSFDQFLVIIQPVVALYFGQFIVPPNETRPSSNNTKTVTVTAEVPHA